MPDRPASRFATSHLVLGATPSNVAGPFVVTGDLDEAVRGLKDGATVVLPDADGSFDLAEAVLLAVGSTPEHARFSRLYAEGRLPGMTPEGVAKGEAEWDGTFSNSAPPP